MTTCKVVTPRRGLRGSSKKYPALVAKSIKFKTKWELPGHGSAYFDCGIKRFRGCLNIEKHTGTTLDGDVIEGKAYVEFYRRTCCRAECPTCYESWAGKEAGKIAHRLRHSPKQSLPIHVILSPSRNDVRALTFQKLRRKSYKVAISSGFRGGSCIFHPFRLNKTTRKWYWSPHFHLIGFGWIEYVKENYRVHGWVIKNLGVRKSVVKTALYQLSHSGVHEKFHVVTWFGSLAYNKGLKIPPMEPEKHECPVCGQELKLLQYRGTDLLPDQDGGYWLDSDNWIYKPLRYAGEYS